MPRGLVGYFASIGVTDQHALKRWTDTATFEHDFKGRIHGLGQAVFQWLVMRQGVDTVRLDVHVHRFAARLAARLAAHQRGYVLNHERNPSPRYLALHRADFWTMAPRKGGDIRTWASGYLKASVALTDWAEANARWPPRPCGTCQPAD